MKHPDQTRLALVAGGDLRGLEALTTKLHLRSCAVCSAEVDEYRQIIASLKSELQDLPPRLHWNVLAAEMTANIHLGVQAAQCVAPERISRPGRPIWRIAAATAGMAVLITAAWWLNPPPRTEHALRAPEVEMRATTVGIELKENGNALMLLHTREGRSSRPLIVSAPGTLRSRFVDTETGQVTINHVYAD
jgi:hypothetical protein